METLQKMADLITEGATVEAETNRDHLTIVRAVEALMRNVKENSEKLLALKGELSGDIGDLLSHIDSPGKLADLVAANLNLRTEDAQNLLELFNTPERLKKVNDLLARELALTTVQAKIQTDVKDEISKNQRDYYLREQVKAIHRELGESDDKLAEIHEFKARIKRCKLPKECEEEAVKQLRRLEQMHSDSSEASVVRTYLDTIVELPWNKFSYASTIQIYGYKMKTNFSIIFSKVGSLLATLLIMSFIIFMLVEIMPGDVAQMILGQSATDEAVTALREARGLNDPVLTRYFRWVGGVVRGDLGDSIYMQGVAIN